MKFDRKHHYPLAVLAAAGLITAGLGASQPPSTARAQDAPPPPPRDGGPGPREDGPDPKHGPKHGPRNHGPDGGPAAVRPVDPQAAPAAVKTATDAVAGFAAGQVWTRTAPRGEPQLQATVLFQNKEVTRLEFDPATGNVLPRGFRPAPPAITPPAPVPDTPNAPAVTPAAATPNNAPPPVAGAPAPVLSVPASGSPTIPEQVKTRLPEVVKDLIVGQGAEVMGREGFWKVPLIYQNRVVGELRVSGDGQKVIQDFGAARDAAIFARN